MTMGEALTITRAAAKVRYRAPGASPTRAFPRDGSERTGERARNTSGAGAQATQATDSPGHWPGNPTTFRWLYALKDLCPEWTAQWECLTARGVTDLANDLAEDDSPSHADDFALFCQQHQRLATLVDALAHAHTQGEAMLQRLERVLIAQFPLDKAWRDAIQHRTSLLRARQKSRKHGAAYLPRILAERRNALVLVREKDGIWRTRKGAPAEQGLKQSGAARRAFLQALMRIPSLTRIEIPLTMDFTGAEAIAADVRRALASRHSMAVAARKANRTWALALRRIQSMGLKGCFDAASQTVIVDPRHLDSLKHEICHWLLEHGVDVPRTGEHIQAHEQQVHALMQELFSGSAPRTRSG